LILSIGAAIRVVGRALIPPAIAYSEYDSSFEVLAGEKEYTNFFPMAYP
jgi:hypothetical protein